MEGCKYYEHPVGVSGPLFYLMGCKKCTRILPEVQTKEY